MVSCAKVDNVQPSPSAGENDWMYDVNLPVPILFGSGNMLTKSTISTLEDLAGQDIGVYALDKNAEKWNGDGNSVYLDNAEAFYDPSSRTIQFGTSRRYPETLYYPAVSDVSLDFYAYCAEGAYDFTVGDDAVTAVVPFGQNDILWAFASASDKMKDYTLYSGYNADYIRTFPDAKPKLAFSHPAVVLRFCAMKASSPSRANIRIENVHLHEMALNGTLYIAERGRTKKNQGQLRFVEGVNTRGVLSLKAEDMSKALSSEGVLLGHMFVLPEPDLEQIVGKVRLTIDGQAIESDLTVNPEQLGAVVSGFVSGYTYNLMLCVYDDGTVEVVPDLRDTLPN